MAEPDIKSITPSILTASAILQAHDLVIEKIDLPEWGGTAFVREMSGFERDGWEVYAQREIEKKAGRVNMRAKLATLVLCDADGRRLFTDEQANELAKKSSAALDRIYEAAIKVNQLTQSDVKTIEGN